MTSVKIIKQAHIPAGEIKLPASKSISNRVLILQYLSGINFSIQNLSEADDTVILKHILSTLGSEGEINAGHAGTVLRFLTSALAISFGEFTLQGSERMNHRPIGSLVDALRQLGASIEYSDKTGFPPIKIKGKILTGNNTYLDAGVSSQMISSLMLIAPFLPNGLTVQLLGKAVSFSYIEMTKKVINYFGVPVSVLDTCISIKNSNLLNKTITIESDWSAASFFYLLAGLWEGAELSLPGLTQDSWQGDHAIVDIAELFGVITEFKKNTVIIRNKAKPSIQEFKYDFTSVPDLVPPVAVWCTLLKMPFIFTGLKSLAIKESNRIEALQQELGKIGGQVEASDTSLKCHKFTSIPKGNIFIKTYNDHRITMSFALAATKMPGLIIQDIENVSKSFPGFWAQLDKAGYKTKIYEQ